MTDSTGIIGDVHGNLAALSGLLRNVERQFDQLILVGDYVDRGRNSAGVIQLLIEKIDSGVPLFCIAGNHDKAFLDCLDARRLNAFLRIGGAATIASYISAPRANVLAQLQSVVPSRHLSFLRELESFYEKDGLLVTHGPERPPDTVGRISFHVYGHIPQGPAPTLLSNSAAIDTGCGENPDGRLTCLAWPTLQIIQVDSDGQYVRSNLT